MQGDDSEDKVLVLLAQPFYDLTITHEGKTLEQCARYGGRPAVADMIAPCCRRYSAVPAPHGLYIACSEQDTGMPQRGVTTPPRLGSAERRQDLAADRCAHDGQQHRSEGGAQQQHGDGKGFRVIRRRRRGHTIDFEQQALSRHSRRETQHRWCGRNASTRGQP